VNHNYDYTLPILVKRAKQGDEDAFHELFKQLSDRVFCYAHSRVSTRDDAIDVVQETFIELWKSLKTFQYRSEEAFYGFVFIILKRRSIKYYKTQHETLPLDEEIVDEQYEVEREDYRHLLRHVNALAEKYQELLKLRYWSGMKFREIAGVLNIKETTAKVWHHRALRELKISLGKFNE